MSNDAQSDTDRITNLEEKIDSMDKNIKAMRDILDTWNHTKGFVITIKIIAKVLVWCAATGAAFTAAYQAIKHIN